LDRNRELEKEIRKEIIRFVAEGAANRYRGAMRVADTVNLTPTSYSKFFIFSRRGGFPCTDGKEKGDTCVSPFSSDFSGDVSGK
jgi:hypothetical protein